MDFFIFTPVIPSSDDLKAKIEDTLEAFVGDGLVDDDGNLIPNNPTAFQSPLADFVATLPPPGDDGVIDVSAIDGVSAFDALL